jgi:hypothetical protein
MPAGRGITSVTRPAYSDALGVERIERHDWGSRDGARPLPCLSRSSGRAAWLKTPAWGKGVEGRGAPSPQTGAPTRRLARVGLG